jgi:hypothetical protein
MAEYRAPQYGNVLLMDPDKVNANQGMTNSIPQYQDMFIFAELIGQRKGRSVIEISSQGSTSLQQNGMDNNIVVNFIGNNQDTTQPNPNYLNFTTNWYEGSSGDRTQFEGFGISNIKVVINSSYIPQVDIEFIDLRGNAFFNRADSPYRILFDFPPPVFQLTLKGYYGMALSYKLHLVKYTSEFRSENGNYVINAQFVAVTFAPLSDVLFRYIVNFPLITEGISSNPNPGEPPQNTYSLILKIKSLYSQYDEKKNTTPDMTAYNNILLTLGHNTDVMSILAGYNADNSSLRTGGIIPVMYMRNNSFVEDNGKELVEINGPGDYDTYLKTFPTDGLPNNLSQRLIIGYLISENIPIDEVQQQLSPDGQNYARINSTEKLLNTYKTNELLGKANAILGSIVDSADIPDAKDFTSQNPVVSPNNPNVTNMYTSIDVTNYYVKLYKQRADLIKRKTDSMIVINEKINDLVLQNLGMKPTIYNIFKIILNDVDKFFNILRTTSIAAENHHNKYVDRIITDPVYKDVKTNIVNNKRKIFSFPLVIKTEMVCNQQKQSRTVPLELSRKVTPTDPFPEIKLLVDFIDTFTKQQKITEQLSMRAEQNANGTNRWIPISPVDSKLATSDMASPYLGVDNSNGGSLQQPINLSTDSRLVQVFKILLKRFYILSQNSYADSFYNNGQHDQGAKALVDMYGKSESLNLSASITNTEYTNLLATAAKVYGTQGNLQAFYDYLKDNVSELYSFTEEEEPYFQISNGKNMYTNKQNTLYEGFKIYSGGVSLQVPGGDSSSPIDSFQKTVKIGKWKEFWNGGAVLESLYGFTDENVFFIKDVPSDGKGSGSKTRFLAQNGTIEIIPADSYQNYSIKFYNVANNQLQYAQPVDNILFRLLGINKNKINRLDFLKMIGDYKLGNSTFSIIGAMPIPEVAKLEMFGDIVDIWIDQLSKHDTEIMPVVISGFTNPGPGYNPLFNPRLSALVILSNFGYTLSPFNIYPHFLNQYVFNEPAAVEIPTFLPAYMGAMVGVVTGTTAYKDAYNFFVSGSGKNLNSSGVFVFADSTDINDSLSITDKETFQTQFHAFYGDNGEENTLFYNIIAQFKTMYMGAQNASRDATSDSERIKLKRKYYQGVLNADTPGSYYDAILKPLFLNVTTSGKDSIINYNQITFSPIHTNTAGYVCLKTVNDGATAKTPDFVNKKAINDNYFGNFFKQLAIDISTQQNKIVTQDNENKKLSGDDDILTQCYYSFKNINDKWLSGPLNTQSADANAGYPYGEITAPNMKLIDNFVFVDRAMNPIGDTIINPEILINILDNPEVNVLSVISQILSMNGFEFFPLQNFMKYQNGEWEKSFQIDTSVSVKTAPTFVCMYIGGGSSYPTGMYLYNQFDDDGINDLSNNSNAKDFWTFSASTDSNGNPVSSGCYSVPSEDNQMEKNKNFPWRQVRAFRVKFGSQNQSMFKDIKIDSKEYPETNESLKILSNIAGDNKLQASPPKGQNLYNLYENRAYRATVTGLGNVMIQPTQYFQLENIPLFNGAYVILSVEHNVEPNKMTTSFSGMKILQYPVPRVKDSSAILGFDGGNSDNTNPAIASANEVTVGVGTAGNPAQTYFNSMYDFKIQ